MPKHLESVRDLLRRYDPGAARLVRSDEFVAMERQAREQMPTATEETIQDLILVKALELARERMGGERKAS
jgi:hypothetical protein